ncbi:Cloroperoxidase [Apiospora arundinis]
MCMWLAHGWRGSCLSITYYVRRKVSLGRRTNEQTLTHSTIMYFTITNAIKSIFNFDTQERDEERRRIAKEDHTYQRLDITLRAPCPGLNALANQGYLPRDGKNITLPMLEAALMEAVHVTGTLAHALAGTMKPVLREDGTFDLSDTRMHNVLEHDTSLTRLDFRQGDNYRMQPKMLDAMIDDAAGGPLTLKTLAKTYNRRNKEHKASGGTSLSPIMSFKDLLVKAGYINTEGTGHPSLAQVRRFWTDERFEDYLLDNHTPRTLRGLVWKAATIWWHAHFW